ncbi:hypothetical protein ACTXT7_016090 [Hymenolepis weldensis]
MKYNLLFSESSLTALASCGVHKANKADRITCARTGWKVRYVTGRIENKCGRACRDLLNHLAIKIPAA